MPAGGADLLCRLLDDGAVAAAVDDDGGAVAGERLGDRLADILARAGDDSDLARKCLHFRHFRLHPWGLRRAGGKHLALQAVNRAGAERRYAGARAPASMEGDRRACGSSRRREGLPRHAIA
jgi:hypothetical protein